MNRTAKASLINVWASCRAENCVFLNERVSITVNKTNIAVLIKVCGCHGTRQFFSSEHVTIMMNETTRPVLLNVWVSWWTKLARLPQSTCDCCGEQKSLAEITACNLDWVCDCCAEQNMNIGWASDNRGEQNLNFGIACDNRSERDILNRLQSWLSVWSSWWLDYNLG